MHGIESNQREVHKRKHQFRYFVEERVLDLVEIAKACGRGAALIGHFLKKVGKFYEKHALHILIWAVVLILLLW